MKNPSKLEFGQALIIFEIFSIFSGLSGLQRHPVSDLVVRHSAFIIGSENTVIKQVYKSRD